jgi:hypothetical protein
MAVLEEAMWPAWLTDLIVKQWGFAVPLMYAAAAYGLFLWLDKKASGPAKQSLTRYLQSAPQTAAVANFCLEVFDRIYTKPLFHVRALCRSALITSAVCSIIWCILVPLPLTSYDNVEAYVEHLLFNITADYISLFVIRRWLSIALRRPVSGLIIAALTGIAIVYISFILRSAYFVLYNVVVFGHPFWFILKVYGWESLYPFKELNVSGDVNLTPKFLAPAFIIHLWLPLFGAAMALTKALGLFFVAAGWMQWFLRQGRNHPFQAVGLVAAVIVLSISAVVHVWSR